MKLLNYAVCVALTIAASRYPLLSQSSVQDQLSASEYAALVDLYNQTSGSTWTNNAGWLTSASNWFGITIDGVQYDTNGNVLVQGHVTSIELDTNGVIGSLPPSLGNLTGIERLSIEGSNTLTATNGLSGTIPDIFSGCSNLAYLDLSVNQLTGAIPNTLMGCANLTSLSLRANQLSGGIPIGLSALTGLTKLDLGKNGLGGNIPDIWSSLNSLTFLGLNSNGFTGPVPESLTTLPNLTTLSLDDNFLVGIIPLFAPPLYSLAVEANWFNVQQGSESWSNIEQMLAEGIDVTYIPNGVVITNLRVPFEYSTASPSDSVDASITPTNDVNQLTYLSTSQPFGLPSALGLGVVADGVTPVLFKITPAYTGQFSVTITSDAAFTNGSLYDRLFVLSDNQWVPASTFNVPTCNAGPSSGTKLPRGYLPGCPNIGYAYLSGLNWTDFSGSPGSHEITITMTIIPVTTPNAIFTNIVRVRPPPLALVHGIADDGTSWSSSFTNELARSLPADFIVPITYGRGAGEKTVLNTSSWPNTYGSLMTLSVMLDSVLRQQFELPLLSDWAFTRYDVVGHSQGGLLLRMLCQTNSADQGIFSFGRTPVVSQQNYFRGRFRRVISIGSPHNGSLMCWYLRRMKDTVDPTDAGLFSLIQLALFDVLALLPNEKFDPFGSSIVTINDSANPVDGRIRFNCIQTSIAGGGPPVQTFNPFAAPACYYFPGLCFPTGLTGQSRGQVLIPNGSDGVVDYDSEGGGIDTARTQIRDSDVAHASIIVRWTWLLNP